MVHFDKIISEFLLLRPEVQDSIEYITREMGHGMADFTEKKIETKSDYDLYCHYVAGLVGIGLSRLFGIVQLENDEVVKNEIAANSMGLFLQKTNIIRDFHEDFQQGRIFWPKEVWSCHVDDLSEFGGRPIPAVRCLNELVLDALKCVPDCIEYLSSLKDPGIFRFCSIPQVMAIATLALCFNNPAIFHHHIKLSRGTTARLFLQSTNIHNVKALFAEFANAISQKIHAHEPQYMEVQLAVEKIKVLSMKHRTSARLAVSMETSFIVAILITFVSLLVYLYLGEKLLAGFS
jgi:farnesyl-diphosphate farnesyltransferase